jgi:uroporphyrinogen-III synthase
LPQGIIAGYGGIFQLKPRTMPKTHSILITRELSEEQRKLAAGLGLKVNEIPAIRISYRDNWLSVQDIIRKAGHMVLAFTSANGVRGFDRFRKAGVSIPENTPVYAVGGKTAKALADAGFDEKDIRIPQQQDGVGLAHLLTDDFLHQPEMNEATVLHFCGNRRRDEFRQFLTELEIPVKDIVAYKTELNEMNLPDDTGSYDGILFYSPSAVQAFRNSGGFKGKRIPELFAIGKTTAEELSIESGGHVHVSPEPDTDVFLKFVVQVLGEQKPAMECPPLKGAMGDDKYLYYNRSLEDLARQLRNNSTKSESRLWTELLQGKKTGYTFLRQRPVLNYIADFLCKDLRFIIELDGYSHEFEQKWKKDQQRQKELEEAGFKVIRFNDNDVMKDLPNVESEIMYWIEKLEGKSPHSNGGQRLASGEEDES